MASSRRILNAVALAIVVSSCAVQKPELILHSKPLGDGARVQRDMYRSYWIFPEHDEDLLRVGIVVSKPSIQFRALERMKIRAHDDRESWDVSSPPGVLWEVEYVGPSRPPVLSYFAAVENRSGNISPSDVTALLAQAKKAGFPSARWIGPPTMDTEVSERGRQRRILSLTPPTSREIATSACTRAAGTVLRKCSVVSRVELPPSARGRLRARDSNFQKDFVGTLELLSPKGPVEVPNLVSEPLRGEERNQKFGPLLFVVPNLSNEFSLVQVTSMGNYLEGVVPAEIFPRAPGDALAAQAIVARTYAARYDNAQYATRPFHICATTDCQVYAGADSKSSPASKAVHLTRDLVLWDRNGRLVETYYHAICGGHTDRSDVIFGGRRLPYLSGVADTLSGEARTGSPSEADVRNELEAPQAAYCGVASLLKQDRWRWRETLAGSDISRILTELELKPPLTEFSVTRRSASGRAVELSIRAGGKKVAVKDQLRIRKLLNGIRSSLFSVDVEKSGGQITKIHLLGGAYGHGVGLCQMGAIGRAEAGQSFEKILEAYYPGTHLAPMSKMELE